MAKGWKNKRIGQIGEFLFCANVARQCDCIATPFAGNVPVFDVLVTDEHCNTVPVQVKTADGGAWQFDAAAFLEIDLDEGSQCQTIRCLRDLEYPDLLLGFVWIGSGTVADRFFVLTRRDLQRLVHQDYARWLTKHHGRRPKNWQTTHCALRLNDLEPFENQWELVQERLAAMNRATG